VKEKLPLDFLDEFKSPSGGLSDLIIKIDFTLPEPFKVRVGPEEVNVSKIIKDLANTNTANKFRLILLCGVCLWFIVAVIEAVFQA
jgi:hypothetical protein